MPNILGRNTWLKVALYSYGRNRVSFLVSIPKSTSLLNPAYRTNILNRLVAGVQNNTHTQYVKWMGGGCVVIICM